jgi:hypothetical protein
LFPRLDDGLQVTDVCHVRVVHAEAEEGVWLETVGEFALFWLNNASMDSKPKFSHGFVGGKYSGGRTKVTGSACSSVTAARSVLYLFSKIVLRAYPVMDLEVYCI